jgi:hypothetical protein
MARVVTVGILFSGKALGGRDAAHRNRRDDAARKQNPCCRCAVARSRLRAIPTLAINAFAT